MNNDNSQPNQVSKKSPKLLGIYGIIILLIILAISLALFVIFRPAGEGTPTETSSNYLIGENKVLCVLLARTKTMQCQNLETDEFTDIKIPNRYVGRSVEVSPNGDRFLVQNDEGDLVTTDISFNDEILVDKFSDEKFSGLRYYQWGASNSSVLAVEIKREENDADFLPEPIVVTLYNLETKENKAIYKTGENIDVDSIRLVGINDEYLFITQSTPKNWVADDVNPPANALQAVKLSDGSVSQIAFDTGHLADELGLDRINLAFTYDAGKNLFMVSGQNPTRQAVVAFAKLSDTPYGLGLDFVQSNTLQQPQLFSVIPVGQTVFTTKGIGVVDYYGSDVIEEFTETYSLYSGNDASQKITIQPANDGEFSEKGASFISLPALP